MTGPGVAPPPRPHDGHKHDFGRVGILGGCAGPQVMLGAPVLAGRAALRAGSGGVVLMVPDRLVQAALALLPEAIGMPLGIERIIDLSVEAMVVGPGLGPGGDTSALIQHVLGTIGVPGVVDADGLNAIATMVDDPWPASRQIILTPHLGEYARLAERYGLPIAGKGDEGRRNAALALAQRTGTVVVLKGFQTVVASPDDGVWTCATGGNTLAVPGSGDVLAGLLGSLIAARARQGEAGVFEAAKLAVHTHGLAGDRYAATVARRGMLARELADQIPAILDMEASA